MTNIASVLKAEIARVARKEVRAEVEGLKRASAQYRAAIAQLRREVAELEKFLKRTQRQSRATSQSERATKEGIPRRFSATRLAAHRAKVGLSAAAYGELVGMSGATIYLWEQGKSRPNPEQLEKLAAVRALGRRALLEQASSR
ncbi:MAG: helix-turn-helix transcriptional regulator [Proteobacteria bacterium]|nr:helix-turn-helix transcriptional regulator [Pseudomonadota bacterium]